MCTVQYTFRIAYGKSGKIIKLRRFCIASLEDVLLKWGKVLGSVHQLRSMLVLEVLLSNTSSVSAMQMMSASQNRGFYDSTLFNR